MSKAHLILPRLILAALGLGLAGCTFGEDPALTGMYDAPPPGGTPVTSMAVAPPVVAPVLVHMDGSYQGRAHLVSGTGAACPNSGLGVLEIGDHTLNFAYQPNVVFIAPVLADGTLHDVSGLSTLDGKIANDQLTMTIKAPGCETHYAADFVWNHS